MQTLQNLIWLWVILGATIIPAITKYIQTIRRKALVAQIEKERGTKVIMMIQRQSTGILGMLAQRYIDLDDSERIMALIREAGDRPIDLVLHTPGGLVIAAEQIARILRAHKPGVTAIVPQYAMSGGTMLCLAADQVLMDENAMLGPVDPQINSYPASAYLRVLREKEKNAIQDDTIMMADLAEKAVRQTQAMLQELLTDRMGAEKAAEVATLLSEGRWTHDYPLHFEQLQAIGLPVSTSMPESFWQLLGLVDASQPKTMRKVAETK